MKSKRIIVFVVAVILLVLSVVLLSDDLFSPYVSFAYAQANPDKYVQVMGNLDKTQISHQEKGFSFIIKDEAGAYLKIFYEGAKPLNFEHSEQVVVLGKFSKDNSIFLADKLLVKCPSKYTKEKVK